jgi:hypothetical protein
VLTEEKTAMQKVVGRDPYFKLLRVLIVISERNDIHRYVVFLQLLADFHQCCLLTNSVRIRPIPWRTGRNLTETALCLYIKG